MLSAVLGSLVSVLGAFLFVYPEASYRLLASWKHDGEASLSDAGKTDRRVTGAVLLLVGIGLIVSGLA